MRLPAELRPEQVTGIIDSREQCPLDLAPLQSTTATLTTGDYSVAGLEHHIAIERKSLPDLLACVGTERERFDREVMRLLAYPVRALIVESTWQEIEAGEWRSKVSSSAAIGSLDCIRLAGCDGGRPRAGRALRVSAVVHCGAAALAGVAGFGCWYWR